MVLSKRSIAFLLSAAFLFSACSKGFQSSTTASNSFQSTDPGTPATPPPDFTYKPLLWEPVRKDSKPWSDYVYSLLQNEARDILKASDFTLFCPKYDSLTEPEKINTAGMLISAIVKYESGFDPTSRYLESSMGTDPITGSQVYSEGLMQLSYQDANNWSFCDFDWNADKNLSPTDPQKTILDPYKNLSCGMQILAAQVRRYGQIAISSGAYWSVIKEGSSHSHITEISKLVSSLEFCR